MRHILVFFLLVLMSGCGNTQPTLAGGKPVSYWVKALQDPDAKLRKKAVFKLGNVGATDEAVVPALMGALKDADAGVRCEAILALLKSGAEAKQAIPALTDVQKQDRDPKARDFAAKALEKLKD